MQALSCHDHALYSRPFHRFQSVHFMEYLASLRFGSRENSILPCTWKSILYHYRHLVIIPRFERRRGINVRWLSKQGKVILSTVSEWIFINLEIPPYRDIVYWMWHFCKISVSTRPSFNERLSSLSSLYYTFPPRYNEFIFILA